VYETDGYGNNNLMDDANLPNLTGLPYIGWCSTDDATYVNTRKFTLSSDDPYYYTGKYASGLGSPHTPKGWVWPLGMIDVALTTTKRSEITHAIDMLDQSDTINGLMHESVNPNDPTQFTRPDFGWANAFWADLLFRTVAGYPAVPYVTLGTVIPLERSSEIPTISPLYTQLGDTTELVGTFGSLLAQKPSL
jgi:meiotically up-regulated gene 157 (Mug157) protein